MTQTTPHHRPESQPLRFWRNGQLVCLNNVTPGQTLLSLLRETLRCSATKEGCAAGDCGACTVVVGRPSDEGLGFEAINSCIRPAHAVDGLALWTASDLGGPNGELHPVQMALAQAHGSQCGFCTPGFVMSLFALYQRTIAQGRSPSDEDIHEALSGNLCRCTGYRPIVQAAHQMALEPPIATDVEAIRKALLALPKRDNARSTYALPTTLDELLQLRSARPHAKLIAGATDAGLELTQRLKNWDSVIDLSRVAELKRVESFVHHIAIGAAVPLQQAFDALSADRPQIHPFGHRFAGWPIRQSGTMGGNIANGSPIGDSMPLLLALGASVVLMRWHEGVRAEREVLLSDFYTGYRQTAMASDEVLAFVQVPKPVSGEWLGIYKVAKRNEDDISAVCLGLHLVSRQGHLIGVRIGVGGVAATPVRALKTEAVLEGQADTPEVWAQAMQTLTQEFNPLSDLRASADYRRRVLANLLERAWIERRGHHLVRLEDVQ
ncbi:MAG: 6-hydroxypseudooxynicotine dehydrogenase complex subunit beta [Pseudomonadota bacterium]